jgi:uncharacterized Ntn-hydrolase superfamily protein
MLMTLSIVARCARTGQLGISAATAVPAVGKFVTHAEAQCGAIATQARVNPYLGIDGLTLLRKRLCAADVLAALCRADPRIEARQLGIVDSAGRSCAHTGNECLPYAGSKQGAGFSVQGNRLAGPHVIETAAEYLEKFADLTLAERLLRALSAAEDAGGDREGEESAVLYVVDAEEYPLWDMRVDQHRDPVAELERLYPIFLERLLPDIARMPTRRHPAGLSDEEDI